MQGNRRFHLHNLLQERLLVRSVAGAGPSRRLFFLNGSDLGADAGVHSVCTGVSPILVEACRCDMSCIASRMMDLVRTAQPTGPYLLAGFCFGGFVALEVARRLKAAGQEVESLFLVETPHLSTIRRLELPRKLRLVALRPLYALRVLVRRSRTSIGAGKPAASPPDLDLAHYLRLSSKTLREYSPEPYPGKIVLIFGNRSRYRFFPTSGWRETATGGCEVHLVDGNHTLDELLKDRGISRVVAGVVRTGDHQGISSENGVPDRPNP